MKSINNQNIKNSIYEINVEENLDNMIEQYNNNMSNKTNNSIGVKDKAFSLDSPNIIKYFI